jgi:hypothetical protein
MPPKQFKFTDGFKPHPQSVLHSWPAKTQYSTANTNLEHLANSKDNGFKQVDIPTIPDDPVEAPGNPTLPTADDGETYLNLIEQKLSLARQFILTEIDSMPDFDSQDNPYQDLSKDAVARRLATSPVIFTMHAQNIVRDLVMIDFRLR